MARSPLNLGLNFAEPFSAAAVVRARDRNGGFRNWWNALARPRRRVDQCGVGIVVEVYRSTHDRLPCFQAPIAQRIRRFPPIADLVGCNMTNSYDSCPLPAELNIGSHSERPTGSGPYWRADVRRTWRD